jgi:hypothetical protein
MPTILGVTNPSSAHPQPPTGIFHRMSKDQETPPLAAAQCPELTTVRAAEELPMLDAVQKQMCSTLQYERK